MMGSLSKNVEGNKAPLLNVGETVKVMGSSGEIDEGWQITSLDAKDAMVQKKLNGEEAETQRNKEIERLRSRINDLTNPNYASTDLMGNMRKAKQLETEIEVLKEKKDLFVAKRYPLAALIELNRIASLEKNEQYVNLSPEERKKLIYDIADSSIKELDLRLVAGAGYFGFNIGDTKPKEGEMDPYKINNILNKIEREFLGSLMNKLEIPPGSPEDRLDQLQQLMPTSGWSKDDLKQVYKDNPAFLIKQIRERFDGSVLKDGYNFAKEDPAMKQLDENIEILNQQFKIHLQPKKEYIPAIIKELLEIMKDDDEVKKSIVQIKVSLSNNIEDGEVFPEIVIYPKVREQDRGSYGKVLGAIIAKFGERAKELGSGNDPRKDIPRMNQHLNELVNVAQSGGDFKNMLRDLGLLDRYFDKTKNYGIANQSR